MRTNDDQTQPPTCTCGGAQRIAELESKIASQRLEINRLLGVIRANDIEINHLHRIRRDNAGRIAELELCFSITEPTDDDH